MWHIHTHTHLHCCLLWYALQGTYFWEASQLLYTYILHISPRDYSLVWSYKFTVITFVEPIFKERIIKVRKQKINVDLELMRTLIYVMYLIVFEAAGSREHIDFWACVWSLTFSFFKTMDDSALPLLTALVVITPSTSQHWKQLTALGAFCFACMLSYKW